MKKNIFRVLVILLLVFGVSNVFALNVEEDLTLTEDINEQVVIDSDKNVTIDLNGFNITVTGANIDAISNHGTLTIKGTGTVSAQGAAITNYPGATATIDNGNYSSTGWYTIKNMGVMTINNLTFTNNVNNGASMIDNGYVGSLSSDRGQTAAAGVKLTINGGTFENKGKSCNTIKNDDFGVLVINGGTFTSSSSMDNNANPVIQNWHIATINGGTFTSTNGWAIANGYCDATSDVGELTIKGGTFKGSKGLFATNGGATANKGFIKILDGKFTGDATYDNSVYELIVTGGVFDSENITPATDYKKYEVLTGKNKGKFVVVKTSDLKEVVLITAVNAEAVPDVDKELINNALKNKYKVAGYFNVQVAVETPDGDIVGYLTETEADKTIKLAIPSDTPKVEKGYKRTYAIVKLHNDVATLITNVKTTKKDVSATSKEFSTYTLVYFDTLDTVNPKTSDNIIVYIGLIGLSMIAMIIPVLYIKNKMQN